MRSARVFVVTSVGNEAETVAPVMTVVLAVMTLLILGMASLQLTTKRVTTIDVTEQRRWGGINGYAKVAH